MNINLFFFTIGFSAKENNTAIFTKKYANNYAIEIDCDKQTINYGDKIICESKTTCNFSQPGNIICKNEIIKIEDGCRTGDVKDFYGKWNKLTKNNGVFENGILPYNFQSKVVVKSNLKEIKI